MLSVLKARDLNFVIDLNLRLHYEILNLLNLIVTFNKEVMRIRIYYILIKGKLLRVSGGCLG